MLRQLINWLFTEPTQITEPDENATFVESALAAFAESPESTDQTIHHAYVIGSIETRTIVRIDYAWSKPMRRAYYSVDDQGNAMAFSFDSMEHAMQFGEYPLA